jgi:GAF domain-containing protein
MSEQKCKQFGNNGVAMETLSTEAIVSASAALRDLLVPGEAESTLTRVTAAAVELVPGVEHASVTLLHAGGAIRSYAMTGALVGRLDERQVELGEGPCYDSTVQDTVVVTGDLLKDPRYPRFGPFADDFGIRSQAGVRLFERGRTTASLNLYGSDLNAFSDVSVLIRLFSHQAAVAVAYSLDMHGLKEAVESRSRIGRSIGIVMERYQLSDQQAFAFLTRLSQQGNVKLRQVAEEITAAVPRP